MMRILSVLILFLGFIPFVFGQIQQSIPFKLKGNVDANFMQHSFFIDEDICTISRVDGKQNRTSSYAVSRYNTNLESVWHSNITTAPNEDLLDFFELETHIYVLINGYNPETRVAYISRAELDKKTGDWLKSDTIISDTIAEWESRDSKAMVKETFQSALLAIQYAHYVVPLEFRYQVSYSPDSSKIMVYRYDYSKDKLWVNAKVYDRNFHVVEQGRIPVDDYYICYGMGVNNEGEVILYKANENGRVVTVRFHLKTEDYKYVGLYTTNSTRDNLMLWQQDVDHLYMAKLNRQNKSFVGITFSRFNFLKEKVDESRFQSFESTFKNELLRQQKEKNIPNLDKDWYHYELTDFFIDTDSNRIIIVEERNILSTEFEYKPEMVEELENWIPRIGRVKAGTLILFVFDKNNKLIYKQGIIKNQDIDATDGLNTISYSVNHHPDHGLLQLIMAEGSNSTLLNHIRFIEIDYVNGVVNRNERLDNPNKLTVSRPFTLFKDGMVYFVGKKGLFGKKSFFVKYKL